LEGIGLNLFKYKFDNIFAARFFLFASVLVPVAFLSFVGKAGDLRLLPPLAWLVLMLYFAMSLGAFVFSLWLWCPTAVDEVKISKIFFGKSFSIQWDNVNRIEKTNFYFRPTEKYRFKITFHSQKWSILVDDYILGMAQLIDMANHNIEQYHIPTFEIDRADEDRKAPIVLLTAVARGGQVGGSRKSTRRL
jgi:hypothetical protein